MKKENKAAKPDPDADYVGDDEDYGYSEGFEDDDDVDFAADEEDNEPVYPSTGMMPGAIFGLPLHSYHFQKIKYFVFLKATSCIYY